MTILDDLMASLRQDDIVRDVRQGVFQTAVLTNKCGLAGTPASDNSHHGKAPVKEAGKLVGQNAREIAKMAYSDSLFEATIGMAALNSLLEVDEASLRDLNARDLLVEKCAHKKIAIIGHFPFVPILKRVARELWVIEQHPQEGDYSEDQAENLIPQADVIGITGMAFSNHTIDYILNLSRKGAFVCILGPTTPLSTVLFEYGVSALSGVLVVDAPTVLRFVGEGATFRQIKGVRLVTLLN